MCVCVCFSPSPSPSVAFGAVYIFVFLNDKDERTRWKYTAYYIVWEIENLVLVVMFLMYTDPATWYYIPGECGCGW